MKKIFFCTCFIVISSCSCFKKEQVINNKNVLTEIETKIISDFLEIELKKELYKNYKNYSIIVIEEALKKMKSIDAYLYSLDEWNTMNKINKSEDVKNMYFLESLQITNIKDNLKDEEVYHWKETDFRNIKVKLLKFEELRKTTNNGRYLKNNLIIFLSRPLLIDNNTALLSFDVGNGDLGNYAITHFTVLMQKVNGIWIQKGYYEDGVYY